MKLFSFIIELTLQANLGATTTVLQVDGDRSAELIQYLGATVVSSEAFPPTQGIDYVKVVSVISPSTSGPTSIICFAAIK